MIRFQTAGAPDPPIWTVGGSSAIIRCGTQMESFCAPRRPYLADESALVLGVLDHVSVAERPPRGRKDQPLADTAAGTDPVKPRYPTRPSRSSRYRWQNTSSLSPRMLAFHVPPPRRCGRRFMNVIVTSGK